MKPLLLKPIPDYTIWGGNTLSQYRGYDQNYGTWWEVSAHPYCTNEVTNLEESVTLQELIDRDPEGMLGKGYSLHEMLRLAYLDSIDRLSIQVHPYDEYAWEHVHDNGKFETWYILDAKPGANLVAGTTISDPEVIRKALEDHTLDQYLRHWPVKKGDYITIPDGMLHALGKDIVALEVGTNSNTTYRFYDYGRTDAQGNTRPLHLKESFDVADFSKEPHFVPAEHKTHRLGDTPVLTVDEIYADQDQVIDVQDTYGILSNVGEEKIQVIWEDQTIEVDRYNSLFIPHSAQEVTLKKGAHVLFSQPRKKD